MQYATALAEKSFMLVFNIISLNQSEYVKYIAEDEYDDIENLSGTCLNSCSYETELFADYYYLILNLDE